jgi:2-keto-4-pentenoate hydratase/2-oxohepta-3-ene-1,7-dioic acid hydratase in catechol pathway
MVQRFVRIQPHDGMACYGQLQTNRTVQILTAPPWENGTETDQILLPEQYTLLSPCTPSKIIGVGKNYRDHAAEMQSEVPPEPLIFLKPPTTLAKPDQTILYPQQSQQVEYEGELALILGRTCQDCAAADARPYIWGYTIANDVTARDLQRKDGQWTRAKGFDGFCPLGPWIVRSLSKSALLETFVNDEATPRQSTTLDQMVFSPEQIVAHISQIMTLLPGDVILTGTPAGVGPLHLGDQVRVKIEGIGVLQNSIGQALVRQE